MKAKILLTSLLVGCALFFGTAAIASADDPNDWHDNWHDDWDDDDDDDDDRDHKHHMACGWAGGWGGQWGGYWGDDSHDHHDFDNCPNVIIVFYYVPAGSFYPQVAAGAPFYMHAGQPTYGGFPGYPWLPGMGY